MKKIAVIGYGTLGKIFVKAAQEKLQDLYEIEGVFVRKAIDRKEITHSGLKAYDSVEELLEGNAEYVIEIASGQAVEEDGLRILNAGKNLIITSVGALADEKLME